MMLGVACLHRLWPTDLQAYSIAHGHLTSAPGSGWENSAVSEAGPANCGGPQWGVNVGGFEKHYGVWLDGLVTGGWVAKRKTDGKPRGPRITAQTLDELAELLEAGS
jgi:hypothetical protein